MTREEQINLYLKERNIPITSLEANSIIEGIEWADKHPNISEEEQVGMDGLRMFWQKQTFIKKACEWLRQHYEDYDRYDAWKGDYVDFDTLIQDFKQAMNETSNI